MDTPVSQNETFADKPVSLGRWKSMLATSTLGAILIVLFLGAGLWLGPYLRASYDRLFPQAAYVTGNYDALYRQAGKRVVMFSTSTCPYCKRTRELLTSEHVDFQDFVIDQSTAARTQFETLGGGGVPLIFIGDRRIAGFREAIVRESLASLHP
jgi:glutaredoxin